MKQYKEIKENELYEIDGTFIPADSNNQNYITMQAEVAANDAEIVDAFTPSFDEQKAIRKNEINKKTDELILAGITHNSVDFKINVEKEISAMALNSQRAAGADMAGKKFRAKDGTYTFVDNADFDEWFSAAFTRVETLLVDGSELKDSVDAATTQAELDAVVDNRT